MSRKLSLKELREAFEKGGDLQNIECDWEKLEGGDWSVLLSNQPKFADKCDWKKLDGGNWSQLLIEQPQFADKCNKWDEFDSEDWRVLLSEQPQFADKCNWDELDSFGWSWLLSKQPQFADKCDSWDEFESDEALFLLLNQPQFIDECNLYDDEWSTLLSKHPQLAAKCDCWDEFDSEDWRFLLSNQPQFADKCDWKKLKGDDWQKLLEAQPQFVDKYKLYHILSLEQDGDSIVVYCKGERKFEWDLYDGGALFNAIEDLRKIIETLPPDEGAELVEQGICIDTEDIALPITLEVELNLEVCNINDNAADYDLFADVPDALFDDESEE